MQMTAHQKPATRHWLIAACGLCLAVTTFGQDLPETAEFVPQIGPRLTDRQVRYGPSFRLAFSPDGKILASAGATVKLWDVSTGKILRTLRHPESVASISFPPDGESIASGDSVGTIRVWSVESGEILTALEGHGSLSRKGKAVESLEFSPDGSLLASGGDDETVRLWDLATEKNIYTMKGHHDVFNVYAVSFSPDGTILASAGTNGTCNLWRVATGTLLHALETKWSAYSCAFFPGGKTVISGSALSLRLWDVATGKKITTLERSPDPGDLRPYGHVTLSANRQVMASCAGKQVKIWDPAKRKPVQIINVTTSSQGSEHCSIALSGDGGVLATADETGLIRLRNLSTGRIRILTAFQPVPIDSVSTSSDGSLLASVGKDGEVRLSEVETGKLRRAFEAGTGTGYTVALSPDTRFLASAA